MLSTSQLVKKMEMTQYPNWVLSEQVGYQFYTRRKFECDLPSDAADEAKIKRAIEVLISEISLYPENTIFSIELKKTIKSGSDGVLPNIVFSKIGDVPTTQIQGLNGIPNNQAHQNNDYISKDYFDKMMEYMKKEQSLVAREAVLDNEQKRIKELEKKFDSGIEKFGKVLTEYGPPLLKGVAGMFMGGMPSTANALSGTVQETTQTQNNFKVETESSDEREEKAVEIANRLFESNLTVEQLNNFINNIDKIENPINNGNGN